MRIDTKLIALNGVIQNDEFVLDSEYILNDQYVKINNWANVCTALRVLQEVEWMPNDEYSRLIKDYLDNRGDNEILEVPANEFQMLEQAVHRYDSGLPIIISVLKTHAVSTSDDTIWVEIKSISDPSELVDVTQKLERALNVAGQAGSSFRFVGVAQGSDWLGFIPNSELTGTVLNYCIGLAAKITMELMKMGSLVIRGIAVHQLASSGNDTPSQEDIDKQLDEVEKTVADLIVEEGINGFKKHLEEAGYPAESQNQIGVAIRATTESIANLAQSNQAVFEQSEEGKKIIIEIHGNNNQITIQNFPELPNYQQALPPSTSDDPNDNQDERA